MNSTSFSFVDLGIITLMALSILIGIMRGATREILGIAGWLGAFITVFYGLPLFRHLGQRYIANPMLADLAVGGALFLLSLTVFNLLTRTLSSSIKASTLSSLDRSLGMVFGAVRGGCIVSLLYLVLGCFYLPEEFPACIQQARFRSWAHQGATALQILVPPSYLPAKKQPMKIEDLEIVETINQLPVEETVRSLSTLKPSSPLRNLNHLLEKYNPLSPQENKE